MENAKRKAKELQRQRTDAIKSGKKLPNLGGFGSSGSARGDSSPIMESVIPDIPKPSYTAPRYYLIVIVPIFCSNFHKL